MELIKIDFSSEAFRKLSDFEKKHTLGNQIETMINNISRSLMQKRDEQIMEALKECGYEFQNDYQIKRFAEEMATIYSFKEKRILKVGDESICEWNDTLDFENNGNEIKVILGK